MTRHAFAGRIVPGGFNGFRKRLGEEWPEIVRFLDEGGFRNFSLWTAEDLIFGYCESEASGYCESEEITARAALLAERFGDVIEWISAPGNGMRLMYHDFGVVREDKSLIRHRVFMTRLKPGCEEEYKRRHDGLVAARGDRVDPGPDSNFSIWCAGGCIFGYDEIDVTMETEPTPESAENDRAWEMRQLGIMDWITNDVDAMTQEVHAQVRRLAQHG